MYEKRFSVKMRNRKKPLTFHTNALIPYSVFLSPFDKFCIGSFLLNYRNSVDPLSSPVRGGFRDVTASRCCGRRPDTPLSYCRRPYLLRYWVRQKSYNCHLLYFVKIFYCCKWQNVSTVQWDYRTGEMNECYYFPLKAYTTYTNGKDNWYALLRIDHSRAALLHAQKSIARYSKESVAVRGVKCRFLKAKVLNR